MNHKTKSGLILAIATWGLMATGLPNTAMAEGMTVASLEDPDCTNLRFCSIMTLEYSPDGSKLATGSSGGRVQVWDIATETLQMTHENHGTRWVPSSMIIRVHWLSDGDVIASSSSDKTVRFWSISTETETANLSFDTPVFDFAFDSAEDHIFALSRGFTVHRLSDGVATASETKINNGLSLSKEETTGRIAVGTLDNKVFILEGDPPQQVQALKDHKRDVFTVDWSGDNRFLASGSEDKSVNIYDATDLTLVHRLAKLRGRVSSLSFSPDSQYLAAVTDADRLYVWQVTSEAPKLVLEQKMDETANVLDWHPNGRQMALGMFSGGLKLVDLPAFDNAN